MKLLKGHGCPIEVRMEMLMQVLMADIIKVFMADAEVLLADILEVFMAEVHMKVVMDVVWDVHTEMPMVLIALHVVGWTEV